MTEYKLNREMIEYIQTLQSRLNYVKWHLMCDKEFASRRGWEDYNMCYVSVNLDDIYMSKDETNINIIIRNDDYTRLLDNINVKIPVSVLMGDISELDTWLIEYARGCE